MAGINPNFTFADAIYYCGVTDGDLFNGYTKSDMMASKIFDNELFSCMDKTYKDFDEDFKSYSNLIVINRQIRLGHGKKRDIKVFI